MREGTSCTKVILREGKEFERERERDGGLCRQQLGFGSAAAPAQADR